MTMFGSQIRNVIIRSATWCENHNFERRENSNIIWPHDTVLAGWSWSETLTKMPETLTNVHNTVIKKRDNGTISPGSLDTSIFTFIKILCNVFFNYCGMRLELLKTSCEKNTNSLNYRKNYHLLSISMTKVKNN